MTKKNQIRLFNEKRIRTAWNNVTEEWYFSVVDVVQVLCAIVEFFATSKPHINLLISNILNNK